MTAMGQGQIHTPCSAEAATSPRVTPQERPDPPSGTPTDQREQVVFGWRSFEAYPIVLVARDDCAVRASLERSQLTPVRHGVTACRGHGGVVFAGPRQPAPGSGVAPRPRPAT